MRRRLPRILLNPKRTLGRDLLLAAGCLISAGELFNWIDHRRVPRWWNILIGFAVAIGGLVAIRRSKRIAPAGLCRQCGYDLRATPERCPECGTPASATPPPPA